MLRILPTSQMCLGEGAARARFQIPFKGESPALIGERDVRLDAPWAKLRGVCNLA